MLSRRALASTLILCAACSSKDTSAPGVACLAALPGALDPLVLSAFAASPDDVWFAGGASGAAGGFLAHFDGAVVRREVTPIGPVLWWVAGVGATRLACGGGGRILAKRSGAWAEESTDVDASVVLYGIWGAAEDDLWAVGAPGVVLRSRGDGVWRRVTDPAIPADKKLFKVWGSAADDVFIVGEAGTAIHFDGRAFVRQATGATDLFTVHGKKGGPILAVGGYASGVVLRFDGAAWVDDRAPAGTGLSGVFVAPDGAALAGGLDGRLIHRDVDGRWSSEPVDPASHLAAYDVHAVLVAGADRWAVGGQFSRGSHGLIATTRRPLPTIELGPGPDAGVEDATSADAPAASDAAVSDATPRDASPPADAAPRDAAPRADATPGDVDLPDAADAEPAADGALDAGTDAALLPGAGEACPTYSCAAGLTCLPIALAGYQPFCVHPCSTLADCADFPVAACCMVPGPQTLDTSCVPQASLPNATCP